MDYGFEIAALRLRGENWDLTIDQQLEISRGNLIAIARTNESIAALSVEMASLKASVARLTENVETLVRAIARDHPHGKS